jgi:hypothetical protein
MLVGGDRAPAGDRVERHLRSEPANHPIRSRRCGAKGAGAPGWPHGAGRPFVRGDGHLRSWNGPQRFGAGLCRSARAGCRRGLHSPRQDLSDFAGDIPEAKATVLYAVQEPFYKALLMGKTTQAAWRSKPSFYAVSTEDRTINPELERFMAKRMGAKTIEVNASHLSLIARPREITDLIFQACGKV